MKDIIRQLAAQGYSDDAIAATLLVSVEQVRLIISADPSVAGAHQRESPSNSPSASIAEKAEKIGRATLERLAQRCMRQQAEAQALRAEIERLVSADPGPERGRAQRLQKQLQPQRSLRTVQWHLKAIAQRRI